MTVARVSTNARRALSMALAVLLLVSVLTVVTITQAPKATAAAKASDFNPGFIISDQNFFDYTSMTVQEIQNFLNAKGPQNCDNCLRNYKASTYDRPASPDRCPVAITGKSNISAAQMIYEVAQACRINPKVLLVTLQKEMSLVTLSNPGNWRYNIAMGYGCPDNAPCNTDYYGLFYQLHSAAGQFNWYSNPKSIFTWYPVGSTSNILYNPKTSCGKAPVHIKNRATAALYYYTPYQPNKAALDNLYGTGDSCSAYGNRNFWRLWSDWFGSPTGGVTTPPSEAAGTIVTASEGSGTYLIVGGKRWAITDPLLLSAYAPLGPAVPTPSSVISNYPAGGTLSRLILDGTGTPFLVDAGKRYSLDTCVTARQIFGLSCTGAPTLPADLLLPLPSQGAASALVKAPSTSPFLIHEGKRREVFDTASLTQAGYGTLSATTLTKEFIYALPLRAPIIREGVQITATGGDGTVFFTTGTNSALKITPAAHSSSKLLTWLGGAQSHMSADSLALLAVTDFPTIFTPVDDDAVYALTPTGRVELADPTQWLGTSSVPPLDADIAASIPSNGVSLSTPVFIASTTGGQEYLVRDGTRIAVTGSQRAALATELGISRTAHVMVKAVVDQIGRGGPVPSPALAEPTEPSAPSAPSEPSASEPESPSAPTTLTHTVLAGDSVWALARRYGSTVDAIVEANNLNASATIRIGQRLVIPIGGSTPPAVGSAEEGAAPAPATSVKHTVVVGDTVWGLAVKYRTSVTAIMNVNKLGPNAVIHIGQTLTIPVSASSSSPTPPKSAPSSVTHIVIAGDSVWGLSRRYGTTVDAIIKANGLNANGFIRIGQKLIIPKK